MKQKKIAVLLAMALTFSQSTGVVMPVTAEELTEDAGLVESQSENNEETEMAETTEADMTEGEENSGNETAELPEALWQRSIPWHIRWPSTSSLTMKKPPGK